ncbi:HEPN domain-containing protein [Candidatus Woesearchaeota archaeon]|nr:HEPN domain-containing protein [Candidatus Woesearchaeota archaeon]
MSQAKNMVKWCINKAKREREEGKAHRGLVEIKSDIEEAKKHLAKASHNLKAVISFEKTGFTDWSVSAAFYTIYHCFLAILAKEGYESRNQECTIALMKHLKEEGRIKISDEIINALKSIDKNKAHESNVISL